MSSASDFKNGPIPLIEIESNESMKANPIALNLLKEIDPELKVRVEENRKKN